MKIYRTDWKGIGVVFGIILVGLLITGYFQSTSIQIFINASIGTIALIGIVVLLSTVFSYVSISGTTLKFAYILFIRRTIDIKSITKIVDAATYKLAKPQFRSLYIVYKNQNGEEEDIELRITIFPEKTLGKLIKDLKQINPHIELNQYSEKLMRQA